MKVVVTCGPGVVQIDEVRRLTNFSSGELGVRLANAFSGAGHRVICFRSAAATTEARMDATVDRRHFLTSEDLSAGLDSVEADVILQVAALADFEVAEVRNEKGGVVRGRKFSSRDGELNLRLRPARKLIHELRDRFPEAVIVGWKYELEGEREGALAAARLQVELSRTDACVVNGRAWGDGFGLLVAGEKEVREEFAGKVGLATGLVAFCERTMELRDRRDR